jgi:hypothetical protein
MTRRGLGHLMAPPITEKELHKLVAKLSAADKRLLLKTLRTELARPAQDGRRAAGVYPLARASLPL